ncbi:MAG: (2Fe-2S)-binding protein, partial [Pseudomonadota bacterium]
MVRLAINGEERELDVDPAMPLLWAIREQLGL